MSNDKRKGGSLLSKLVASVEAKTGEKVVAVYVHKKKQHNWRKVKCFLGFHEFDFKSGEGCFTDNQCPHCLSFRCNCND